MKKEESIVFDLTGDIKNCSLYFDYVIPINPFTLTKDFLGIMDYCQSLLPDGFDSIESNNVSEVFGINNINEIIQSKVVQYNVNVSDEEIKMLAEEMINLARFIPEAQREFYKEITKKIKVDGGKQEYLLSLYFFSVLFDKISAFYALHTQEINECYIYGFNKKINDSMGWGNDKYPIIMYPSQSDSMFSAEYDCTLLSLSKMKLVNADNASWEKIFEIRKDKDSISKLRNLKTFFYENYSGKEKNFIQDDLLNRIEEYNNTVKDWGFETVTSSLTLINTSVTTVGSSLVLALTGQPLEVAAASGICVGIGNVALHLAKEKHKLMKLGRDHPLAYIIDAKKKLEKE